MRWMTGVAAAAAFLVMGATADAQGPTVTVGLGVLSHTTSDDEDSDGVLALGINNQTVRVGFPLSAGIALEPSLALLWLDVDGGSTTAYNVGALLPIYFGGTVGQGVYAGPGLSYMSTKATIDLGGIEVTETISQLAVGGELGTHARISDPVSLRLAAQLAIGLENDDAASFTTIGALVGLTVKIK